jgi:N-acetylmuramic acid 6-phosphate (MurNAc-6-P) etherase
MIYEIEIITSSKKLINVYKKDQMGVEYACADDLPNLEAAINLIRKKWNHEGNIFIIQDGIRKVLGD